MVNYYNTSLMDISTGVPNLNLYIPTPSKHLVRWKGDLFIDGQTSLGPWPRLAHRVVWAGSFACTKIEHALELCVLVCVFVCACACEGAMFLSCS